jgi:hypothetical protein
LNFLSYSLAEKMVFHCTSELEKWMWYKEFQRLEWVTHWAKTFITYLWKMLTSCFFQEKKNWILVFSTQNSRGLLLARPYIYLQWLSAIYKKRNFFFWHIQEEELKLELNTLSLRMQWNLWYNDFGSNYTWKLKHYFYSISNRF